MAVQTPNQSAKPLEKEPKTYVPGSVQPFFDKKEARCKAIIDRVGLPTEVNQSERIELRPQQK